MATKRLITLIGTGAARKFKEMLLTDTAPEENIPKLGSIAKLPDIPSGKMLARTTAGTGAVELVDIPSGAVNDALAFKDNIDCSANPNYPAADAGFVYRVSVAGKIGGGAGVNVEIGDMLTCIVDGSVAGNHATVGANWTISQTNIDGAVIGQAASIDNELVLFSGTTGKQIKRAVQNGIAFLTNGVLSVLTDSAGLSAAISDKIGTNKVLFSDPVINVQTGTTYTLLASDNGKIIELNNASAITVTVPTALGAGFNCVIVQLGAGQVTLSPSSTTLRNRNGLKTAGQYAAITIMPTSTANTFLVSGDTIV
jgi:hypothetical protein